MSDHSDHESSMGRDFTQANFLQQAADDEEAMEIACENALHVLDLTRDAPRSADDVRHSVTAWVQLGGELGKPHYATVFVKLQAATPYLSVGTHRVLILSALAHHPAEAMRGRRSRHVHKVITNNN